MSNALGNVTNVINPEGNVVSIPHEQLGDALENGYQMPTLEQVHDARIQSQYGSPGQQALAAGAGALRGATLSASDVALTKSGLVSPETLSGLQEANPISSGAGELAGVAGSALLGNELAPVNAISKLGKATYLGAKALGAMRVAEEGTMAAKVLGAAGNVAAHAAGSAVEGAAFAGIGNTLNEYAIGDPALNGEKIMDNFGKGALWGGALGAAIKTAAIGAPPAVTAAKEGLVGLRDLIMGTGEHGSSGLVGKIAPESKFSQAIGQRMTNLDVNQQTDLLNSAADKLNEVHNNTQTAVRDLNKNLRPQEIDALIDTADPTKVMGAVGEIHQAMTNAVQKMEANPALYSSNAAAKITQHIEQLENKMESMGSKPMFEGVPASVFNDLKDIKQSLGNWGYGIMDPTKGDTKNILTGLSTLVSEKLKDPDIFGFVGSSYAEHDEMLKDLYQFIGPNGKPTQKLSGLMTNTGTRLKPNFEFDSTKLGRAFKNSEMTSGRSKLEALNDYFDVLKRLPDHLENTHANVPNDISFSGQELSSMLDKHQQTVSEAGHKYLESVKNQKGSLGLRDMLAATVGLSHPVIGAAYEAYNIATKPFQYMNALAQVERMVGKTTAAIGKGAASVFEPSLKVIGKSKGALIPMLTADQHEETRKDLSLAMNNPEMMVDKLNKATEGLHGVAPDTAGALQQTMIRASQFLQSKMPNQGKTNPFEENYEPSQMELAQFNRYLSVVNKPTVAFDLMKHNLIGPEVMETLNAVYPKLYQHMKDTLVQQMTDKLAKKETVPFQVKQQISMFIGEPIDSSLSPQSIMANQMAMQINQQQQQMQQQQAQNSSKNSKMTLASRTGVQRERDKA